MTLDSQTATESTYRVMLDDGTSAGTFTVLNGQDGVSPTVSVDGAIGSSVTFTVTDASGTHEYTIPTATGESSQLPADWNATEGVTRILNKPDLTVFAKTADLAPVATSGDYNDLTNATRKMVMVTSGSEALIPGWITALLHMHRGDYWRIYIPSTMAYGDNDKDDIPGHSVLIFDLTLVDFSPAGHVMAPWSARKR